MDLLSSGFPCVVSRTDFWMTFLVKATTYWVGSFTCILFVMQKIFFPLFLGGKIFNLYNSVMDTDNGYLIYT